MSIFGNLGRNVDATLGGSISWVEQQWTNRLVQISVFAGVIFWFLSSYKLVDQVDKYIEKMFKLKLGQNGTRALHGAIFGVSIYFLIKFVLDPFVKRIATIEGHTGTIVYDNEDNKDNENNSEEQAM